MGTNRNSSSSTSGARIAYNPNNKQSPTQLVTQVPIHTHMQMMDAHDYSPTTMTAAAESEWDWEDGLEQPPAPIQTPSQRNVPELQDDTGISRLEFVRVFGEKSSLPVTVKSVEAVCSHYHRVGTVAVHIKLASTKHNYPAGRLEIPLVPETMAVSDMQCELSPDTMVPAAVIKKTLAQSVAYKETERGRSAG